jgi:hypothetical protein
VIRSSVRGPSLGGGSMLCVLALCYGCGTNDAPTTVTTNLELPLASSFACANGTSPVRGATLFVSGDLPTCDLTVTAGAVSGTCPNIPTGIDRYLVLRYSGAAGYPIRYAVAIAKLSASELKGNNNRVTVAFTNDGQTGFFVDTDADVAQLATSLYGSTTTALTGAQCFARSVIAADANNQEVAADCFTHEDLAPVLDFDNDGCTNQRETCDGTSPADASSHACN